MRRVIAKAEHLDKGASPRFIVNLPQAYAMRKALYEEVYCARGDMYNASKNNNSTCSPTAPARIRCAPTISGCGSPPMTTRF